VVGVLQGFNVPAGRPAAGENAMCTSGEDAIDVGRKPDSNA
jgi:hypothetical protein